MSKLFPEEPFLDIGNVGFDDAVEGHKLDMLGRKPLGQKLTDLVDRIDQPLVIALDGGWGCGKSHFLKLWAGAHKKELGGKAEVIYFDAFEHDYLDDPLVSLISRLATKQPDAPWHEGAMAKVKRAALPLAKSAIRVGLGVATYGATEVGGAAFDAAITKISAITDEAIDKQWKAEANRISAMQGFRDALRALTGEGAEARKIVFIVDELDRCRPDYALSLLEIIKHFFAVPNVHFVLGVNLTALVATVQQRYGNWTGSNQYLQKFIHVTLHFPVGRDQTKNGAWAPYFDALSKQMDSPQRDRAKQILNLFGQTQQIQLRDVQRFLTRLALLPRDFHQEPNGSRWLGLSALVLQVFAPQDYAALRSNALTPKIISYVFPIPVASSNQFKLAVLLQHLWARALLDTPDAEAINETEKILDFGLADDRQAYFDRFWSETFDVINVSAGI